MIDDLFSYKFVSTFGPIWGQAYLDFINGKYIPLPVDVDIRKEGDSEDDVQADDSR
jgi:hypothetical protein